MDEESLVFSRSFQLTDKKLQSTLIEEAFHCKCEIINIQGKFITKQGEFISKIGIFVSFLNRIN